MALGIDNINTTNVGAEIGHPELDTASALVGWNGVDKKAFWAPGALGVDANKDLIITPPTNNFKIGDYRGYVHGSPVPYIGTASGGSRVPGSSTCTVTVPIFPQNVNWKYLFDLLGQTGYITIILYSNAARTNQIASITNSLSWSTTTPVPVDHTRATSGAVRLDSGPIIVTFPGLSVGLGDVTVYGDVFFSTNTGTRIANLYTAATGLFTALCHEYVYPYVYGFNTNIPTKPQYYTFIAPNVYVSARCGANSSPQNIGTSYNINVSAYALFNNGGGNIYRTMNLPVCYCVLTVGGVETVLLNGGTLSESGQNFTGTLTGGSFGYDGAYQVTFKSGTTVSTVLYLNC